MHYAEKEGVCMKKTVFVSLMFLIIVSIALMTGCDQQEQYAFKTSELSKYVIVYADDNPDYFELANKLSDRIFDQYGVLLSTIPDAIATPAEFEIVLGDTNRNEQPSKVMQYSVTVEDGKFKINVGGSFSAEKAVEFLCKNVFTGKELTLGSGEHYKKALMTKRYEITEGTSVRVMSANILADVFADDSYKNAYYRAEIFAGVLAAGMPDVVGLQEVDKNWDEILGSYLTRLEKAHGIVYSRCLATYEDKLNYTSFLYRSDKLKAENSGVNVFHWWTDSKFNHNYHMRNVSWVEFSGIENSNEKFVVANTHWSYRTEHADGRTYLSGSSKPIEANELREQCKNETNTFLAKLRQDHPGIPILVTGDFNTSLSFFADSGWTPISFKLISEEAKRNGTAASTVPVSGHYDHLFGAGEYTVKHYEFLKDVNELNRLTDHPIVFADLAF